MRIKEIELDNFKSFGKPTKVPMLDGFTTISGPNGSGKSNIIDSLLFALGLSSTRTMRAERLPDLLNNLSGRNEARVTVRFVNEAGQELEVSRRLRVKDNGYTSSYFLNGKSATLTEVHEELIKYNVSPTGFNVIMQGDVTGIVSMSATERRKIIDELAGVADFDRRIDQAEKELFFVAEKIDHQKIVLAEIATRIEILQGDRDQALKYLDLKTQKEKVEQDLIFVRVKELEDKAEAEKHGIEELNEKEQKLEQQKEDLQVELLEHRSELGRIDEEIKEKGGNEQLLIRQQLENEKGELIREESRLANVVSAEAEKAKQEKSIAGQIKTIDKYLNELGRDKKQNQADHKAVQLVLMDKQGALSAVHAEIEVIRNERDRSSNKGLALHEDLQKMRDDKHKLEVRRTELGMRKEQLVKELESSRNLATESIGKSASYKTLIQGLERKLDDEQATIVGMARSIRQMESEAESTEEEIDNKRRELEDINKRLIQLETRREVVGESGYGRAVEALLSAGMAGVHGPIGHLGRVDGRFEMALEIAIGTRLGHVVVEDDGVAERCIQMLKQSRAGRATFVPLNKIQVQPPGLLPNRPGVIDFAYNLVDFNPRFTRAFQYACGQTIVVENLDAARRLMNTARLVTLEGELLEKYGTISGGVDTRNRMHFSQKDGNDLGALRQKKITLEQDLRWLNDQLKELTHGLNQDRSKLNEAKSKQMQRQSEFDAKKSELVILEKTVEEVKPRLRNLADEIESIDGEIQRIEAGSKDIDKNIERLQDEISELTGSGKRSEIDRLIGEAEELKTDLENIERNVKEIERIIDRIETEERVEGSKRGSLEQQLISLASEIAELTQQKPVIEGRISELKILIVDLERRAAAVSQELVALQKERDGIQQKITQVEIEKTKIGEKVVFLKEEREKKKAVYHQLLSDLYQAKAILEQVLAEQPDYQPPAAATIEQLRHQIERLERRMRALEPVNMKALEEYNYTKARQEELTQNLEILSGEGEEIRQRIEGYGELKKKTFMEAFNAVNINFQEIFAELSNGHGKLELEHPDSPFEGGLIIRAQPRDKKMQRIEALSGGEKSLTALSFVFAFQRYAPAPFYAFDEVDMMLDGANAERLARMVKRQSETAQFVAVSLRRPMIENADHAIGVSLRADGYSKVVGIAEIKIPDEEAVRSA